MESSPPPLTYAEMEARLLDALASLNRIGANVNQLSPSERIDVNATLGLIVDSATKVIPGASAVIYTLEPETQEFNQESRVSAGCWMPPSMDVEPRLNGLGRRAIQKQRRILSYEEQDLEIHPALAAFGARTGGCFPLHVAGQPVGVLYVYLDEPRPFSPLEELMLENFVNQAAMAIYQAQTLGAVQQDLERKSQELNQLRKAGLLISSRLRLEDTLEAILEMALDITGAQYGIFRLLDKSGQSLITRAYAGENLARPKVEAIPLDSNSIMAHVARSRQALWIADLRAGPWREMYYPLDAELEMRAELAVPLISGSGRLEGVLNLESPQVGAFGEQDSHLLQSLATQAVIAIQEVRLLDALQEAARLLLTVSYQQVLERLAELARDLLDVDAGVIWTLEDGRLLLRAASGSCLPSGEPGGAGSLPAQAIKKRALVAKKMRIAEESPESAGRWSEALAVPLLVGDESDPVGAFGVYGSAIDSGHLAQSDWEKKVLTCLAQYAALAVRNASHQEALRLAQDRRAVAETFAVVGDVAANLLHQLNNKVGTIPVRVQGIQDKCQPALAADHYLASNLQEIERSASEAMESVRENLSHLRPIHLAEVAVRACVGEALEAASLPGGVSVSMQGLEELPLVIAGQRSLALVFTNLLENAADAMHAAGEITIRGEARADWVEIQVSDNGPGIPYELQGRIFELDYSGRAATRKGKLGFGLWWVKTLMARLGGAVTVESDGTHGTTFRLRLPAAGRKP